MGTWKNAYCLLRQGPRQPGIWREAPAEVRRSMLLWVGCIAGASRGHAFRDRAAGHGHLGPSPVVPGPLQGGFWTPDDRIVFAVNAQSGLLQVDAAGGTPTPVTTLAADEIRHGFPALLPDGRHFLYSAFSGNVNAGATYLGSLDAKPDQRQIKKLLSDRSRPAYVASAKSRIEERLSALRSREHPGSPGIQHGAAGAGRRRPAHRGEHCL